MENVKQYCINKIIGRLDTKREMERVAVTYVSRVQAKNDVQKRYEQAAKTMIKPGEPYSSVTRAPLSVSQSDKQLPKDESKSSFIRRFNKHVQRESATGIQN